MGLYVYSHSRVLLDLATLTEHLLRSHFSHETGAYLVYHAQNSNGTNIFYVNGSMTCHSESDTVDRTHRYYLGSRFDAFEKDPSRYN